MNCRVQWSAIGKKFRNWYFYVLGARTGCYGLRFFTAQEAGAVKELNPLHPWRKYMLLIR